MDGTRPLYQAFVGSRRKGKVPGVHDGSLGSSGAVRRPGIAWGETLSRDERGSERSESRVRAEKGFLLFPLLINFLSRFVGD